MIFNVWDIGGQASMSTVNQCFFTDKALYVVIWNLAMGEEAVANLQTWLLNIEVIFFFIAIVRDMTINTGCLGWRCMREDLCKSVDIIEQ